MVCVCVLEMPVQRHNTDKQHWTCSIYHHQCSVVPCDYCDSSGSLTSDTCHWTCAADFCSFQLDWWAWGYGPELDHTHLAPVLDHRHIRLFAFVFLKAILLPRLCCGATPASTGRGGGFSPTFSVTNPPCPTPTHIHAPVDPNACHFTCFGAVATDRLLNWIRYPPSSSSPHAAAG